MMVTAMLVYVEHRWLSPSNCNRKITFSLIQKQIFIHNSHGDSNDDHVIKHVENYAIDKYVASVHICTIDSIDVWFVVLVLQHFKFMNDLTYFDSTY